MSKEIAQTVGGKKIAYLIAILAAFAVFATIATQFRGADAAEMPSTEVMDRYSAADSATLNTDDTALTGEIVVISSAQPGTLVEQHQGVVASFAQTVRNASTSEQFTSGDVHALEQARGDNGEYIDDAMTVDTAGNDPVNSTTLTTASTRGLHDGSGVEYYVETSVGTGTITATVDYPVFRADDASYPNGQTVQTAADMNEPVGAYDVPNNDHASKLLSQGIDGAINELFDQTNSILAERFTSTNPWDIEVPNSSASGWDLFREHSGSGEVIASRADPASEVLAPAEAYAQEPTGDSQNIVPANSSEVDAKSAAGGGATANWLFAALGLGAIAFGVSGVAVAKRSR